MSVNNFDDVTWSFSRVNSFQKCPYCWYLEYFLSEGESPPSEENAFAEIGSLIHKILEKYVKGELEMFDMV